MNTYSASVLDLNVRKLLSINESTELQKVCGSEKVISNCPNTKVLDAPKLSKYLKCDDNSKYKKEDFEAFLSEDNTDEFLYVAGAKDPKWYVCQHFSTQTFMRGSCFANTNNNGDYEQRTPIKISNGLTSQSNRLPIFYVSIASKSKKLYHAINAIFTGDTVEQMGNIENYILFEPQSDKKYFTVDELRQDWKSYGLDKANDLKLKISVMDTPGSVSDGGLQFRTQEIASFDCSF